MTTGPEHDASPEALLEVVVLHPQDAEAATDGGADRLLLLADQTAGGRAPEPSAVSAIVRATDLPVRVLLRLTSTDRVTGPEFNELIALGTDYVRLGASGLALGFLDEDLELDRASCAELVREVGRETGATDLPWTFHRGFDAALEPDRAWRDVRSLTATGLDAVATAGSLRGLSTGAEELIARCGSDPATAALVLAGGGLAPDQVPWLLRAGVRMFGVGSSVRPDGSWTKAYVDAGRVRAWRLLLDDALGRALGLPVD